MGHQKYAEEFGSSDNPVNSRNGRSASAELPDFDAVVTRHDTVPPRLWLGNKRRRQGSVAIDLMQWWIAQCMKLGPPGSGHL